VVVALVDVVAGVGADAACTVDVTVLVVSTNVDVYVDGVVCTEVDDGTCVVDVVGTVVDVRTVVVLVDRVTGGK
jgi:hypothetical protein